MTVTVKIVRADRTAANITARMTRVPCVGEMIFSKDQVYEVVEVWHAFSIDEDPMIKVKLL